MDERYEHQQAQPLLGTSPSPHGHSNITANNHTIVAEDVIGYHPEYDTDDEDDDEIAPPKDQPVWKSWFHSVMRFFQGLGKFFLILALGTAVLLLVLKYTLPSVDEEQRKDLHFPHSLEDLEALRKILIASSIGATNCYLLSRHFFSNLVKRKFGDRMLKWNTQLERHRNDLMSYIILLRLAPFPPNWFVNICSPHLNVPLWPEFFIGTLIGVTAPSVVHVQAGMVLEKLVEDHSSGVNIFTLKNIGMLAAVAALAALPVLIRWALAKREARKAKLVIESMNNEEGDYDTLDDDPILEPLDPTGLIISPEHQHFLKRSSSSSFIRTDHHHEPQPQPQPEFQPQQQQENQRHQQS
ncbi:Transmembrane protein 41B [Entomortierella beljakovae]|nr:Transmembrane protein 41B [Entomortierella beljakovae]